jgi:hypothetical protein
VCTFTEKLHFVVLQQYTAGINVQPAFSTNSFRQVVTDCSQLMKSVLLCCALILLKLFKYSYFRVLCKISKTKMFNVNVN